jgi:hypothetical protein
MYSFFLPDNVVQAKQGGTGRVRFQPRSGQLLAVAGGSMVNIFDVEKQANLPSPAKVINMYEMVNVMQNLQCESS